MMSTKFIQKIDKLSDLDIDAPILNEYSLSQLPPLHFEPGSEARRIIIDVGIQDNVDCECPVQDLLPGEAF